MAREDFDCVMIRKELAALFAVGNRGRQTSGSQYITALAADGLKYRFMRQNFRPPQQLLRVLLPEEMAVFFAQWTDSIESACGKMGPLDNQYEFAVVGPGVSYHEPDKDCFVPVPKGSCVDRTKTEHGEFPVFRETLPLDLLLISKRELENLKKWLQLNPEI